MKHRKIITTGILITFVIQALVVISFISSKELGIVNHPVNDLEEKMSNKPSIFGNYFYENEGQFGENQICYYGNMPGGSIGFGESKIFLKITDSDQVVTVYFVNAHVVKPIALEEQESTVSYFIGNNGAHSNIIKCEKIAYYNLWSGIDLFYEITNDGIKYEYHINVGANVQDIRTRFEGLDDQPSIKSDKLVLSIDEHQIIDDGLRVFQENDLDIDAEFISDDRNTYGFDVSTYDITRKLIIDPLIYSTFIGGSGYEITRSIVLDNLGNAYIVGSTSSVDFPTSATAYNDTLSAVGDDVIVLKLSADGSTLLYSTFIGGNGTDYGYDIEIDNTGCAFITGCTDSINFPTVNAYDETYNGKNAEFGDCFILKLSSDGSSLIYSTYFGGSGDDIAIGIAIDTTNNIIFTGKTYSADFPLYNAIDDEFDGVGECFFAKLAANGSSIIFSTYFGETELVAPECGYAIDLGNNGDIYFIGTTRTDNITMTDETTFGSYHGDMDIFLVKLSEDGSLLYSTYIGGDSMEYGKAIKVDSANNLYLLGSAMSLDIPLVNAYDDEYNYMQDVYFMKLSMNGSTPEILFSTYLGGEYWEYPQDFCIDSEGNVYITGQTSSESFPITKNAYDNELSGSTDSFLSVISSDGSSLLYSTYIGGDSTEWSFCIGLSNNLEVVLAGTTKSDDFPTEAAYEDTYSGGTDIFVLKIQIDLEQDGASWSFYWSITTIFTIGAIMVLISKKKTKK
ncbi:MAG: SBBP repeat-containing protein [Candidatus Heimdallarchaeota archaeon]